MHHIYIGITYICSGRYPRGGCTWVGTHHVGTYRGSPSQQRKRGEDGRRPPESGEAPPGERKKKPPGEWKKTPGEWKKKPPLVIELIKKTGGASGAE